LKIYVVLRIAKPHDDVCAPYQTRIKAEQERDQLRANNPTETYEVDEWFVN